MKKVDEYMYELIDLLDKLKGMESLLNAFYRCNIENPLDVSEDKDDYIATLSRPYVTILDNLKDTINVIDRMTDDMSIPYKESRC